MTENSSKLAFPADIVEQTKNQYGDVTGYRTKLVSEGLTKREYFAGLAMQGILARPGDWNSADLTFVAKQALFLADDLLKQLEVSH